MPIKIIKRVAVDKRPPAEIIIDGCTTKEQAQALGAYKERTPEESLAAWKKMPPPNAKPIACKFCGGMYLAPCDGNNHGCSNYRYKMKLP